MTPTQSERPRARHKRAQTLRPSRRSSTSWARRARARFWTTFKAAPIRKLDVDEKWVTVPADVGDVKVRIVKPVGARSALPTVLYMHGGGWILGNAGTHDRLVRELAVGV